MKLHISHFPMPEVSPDNERLNELGFVFIKGLLLFAFADRYFFLFASQIEQTLQLPFNQFPCLSQNFLTLITVCWKSSSSCVSRQKMVGPSVILFLLVSRSLLQQYLLVVND